MKKVVLCGLFAALAAGYALSVLADGADTVEVFKPEKSVQCQPESGVGEAALRAELESKGITVQGYRQADDGMIYPAVCGAPTGRIHVFSIKSGDVSAAEAAGYGRLGN